jgi:hypothetical protein
MVRVSVVVAGVPNLLVVTETAKGTDVCPLERKPTVAVDNLLSMVAFGSRDPDTLTTLASRVSRLDRQKDERDQQTIRDASGGKGPLISPMPCSMPWTQTRCEPSKYSGA